MAVKPVKSAKHHWWPTTLAENWTSANGLVSIIKPTGEVIESPPGKFGAITNAHTMKMGGAWDTTFEPLFDKADSEIKEFIIWLSTIDAKSIDVGKQMVDRIATQPITVERLEQIARITASLLARSPRIRFIIKRGNENFRREQGWLNQTVDKNLVAANQRGLYDAYRKHMEATGRWAILFSDEREFIAGDGFFHNFPASQDAIHSGKKLVLPILPTAAIIFMSPKSFPTEPKLVTLRVDSQEVKTLNEITQVYASDFLFFRDEIPEIIEAYKKGEHRKYEYDGHEIVDAMLDDLSQFCNWGKEGAPLILNRRPYSESIEGNRWLNSLVNKDN